jgi:hypothetical protein
VQSQDKAAEPRYYDKEGKPIEDVFKWAKMFEDKDYSRVGLFERPWVKVSTVWLGLNHNWGEGAPLIFETMAFAPHMTEVCQERYATLAQAEEGHAKAVKKYRWRIDLLLRWRR